MAAHRTLYELYCFSLSPKDKKDRPENAQPGPEVVQPDVLPGKENREGHEHGERDRFLQDLELRKGHGLGPEPIGRDGDHILEKRDAPTHERG